MILWANSPEWCFRDHNKRDNCDHQFSVFVALVFKSSVSSSRFKLGPFKKPFVCFGGCSETDVSLSGYENKNVVKRIRRIPREVLVRYEAWKRIIELEGPRGLRYIRGFHDEALAGKWKGFRSSRFGIKWRVMYETEEKESVVYVGEISPHEY